MADDRDYGTVNRKDSMARTLATIALLLSIAALVWAAKADNKANDAMDKAKSVENSVTR